MPLRDKFSDSFDNCTFLFNHIMRKASSLAITAHVQIADSNPRQPIPGLEVVFEFEAHGWAVPDAVLQDASGQFYLENFDSLKPLGEIIEGEIEPITTREVLQWYVDSALYSTGFTGDIGTVIEQALKEWPCESESQ